MAPLTLPSANPSRPPRKPNRTPAIVALSICIFFLFAVIFAQATFKLTFLQPDTSEETLIFAALSALIFLLFVALTFVLIRTLLRLYAERKTGMLGSKFRSRMVLGALLLSLGPVIFLFLFSYGLMNRSVEKWFSRPMEDVQYRTNIIASLLTDYAMANAQAEAATSGRHARCAESFQTGNFSFIMDEFRRQRSHAAGRLRLRRWWTTAPKRASMRPIAGRWCAHPLPVKSAKLGQAKAFDLVGETYVLGRAEVGA